MTFLSTCNGLNISDSDHFNDGPTLEAAIQSLVARGQALEACSETNSPLTNGSKTSTHEPREYQAAQITRPVPGEITAPVSEDRDDVKITKANKATFSEAENLKDVDVANKILDIIENYGIREATQKPQPCEAKKTFLPIVLERVKRGAAVSLVLPAFPFKSPNCQDKVLGTLPDLGEEIALSTLQSLCNNIRQVYEHGANVLITSDGFVYNGKPF